MNKKILIALTFLSVFSSACGSDNQNSEENSKEEIEQRKKDGDTKDYCEIFNWYGDGKCDDFCINEDTDCQAQCEAFPSCGSGSIEVPSCSDPLKCEKVSICGSTIYCEQLDCNNPSDGPIDCGEGYYQADKCESPDPERTCIELISDCPEPVFCNPEPEACFAVPVCAEDYFPVENCKLNDSQCTETTVCGDTISCAPDLDCAAIVACSPEETMYRSRSECENSSEACRQDYFCNSVIWCGGNDACAPPSCGPRPEVPDCKDPEKCVEIVGCGESVVCQI